MSSPAHGAGATQDWIARAAELKAELMARRIPVTTSSHPSMEIQSKVQSQNFAGSVTPHSNATITTIALAFAPDATMASTQHETDAQTKDLKEQLDQLIAQEAPDTQLLTKPASSILTEAKVNITDCEEKGVETGKSVTLHKLDPKKHEATNSSKRDQAVGRPEQDVADCQPLRTETSGDRIDVADQGEPKKNTDISQTLKRKETGDIKQNTTKQELKEDFDGPRAFERGGDTKGNLMPIRSSIGKTHRLGIPASTSPREQASLPPSTTVLHVPKHPIPIPEKPNTKATAPTSKNVTPPSAPRDHERTGRKLQSYRPTMAPSRVEKTQELRGSTRWPSPNSLQLPTRPPFHYRPHDPDPHFDPELDMLASRNHDLKDWLAFTGWRNRDYRDGFLRRKRRLADLAREKDKIERERAELLSADEQALKAAHYRSGIGGADEFDGGRASVNTGRELFGGSPPPSKRKRECSSDYEDDFPRKMSTGDIRGHRRDAPRDGRDDYGKRSYYHEDIDDVPPHRTRRATPDFQIGHRGTHFAERGGPHSSYDDGVRRGPAWNFSSAGRHDDEPSPFSSARLENPRDPPTRGGYGGRGGRGGHRPYRRGA